jgi:hypothetical protein
MAQSEGVRSLRPRPLQAEIMDQLRMGHSQSTSSPATAVVATAGPLWHGASSANLGGGSRF